MSPTKETGAVRKVMNGIKKERTCSYLQGGYCVIHGPGASRHWKPKMVRTKGPDGNYTMRMRKESYYLCKKKNKNVGGGGTGKCPWRR